MISRPRRPRCCPRSVAMAAPAACMNIPAYTPVRMTGTPGSRSGSTSCSRWPRPLSGESICRTFRSGHKFTLAGHQRQDMKAEYVCIPVDHRGARGVYGNSFTAFPRLLRFARGAPPSSRASTARRPPSSSANRARRSGTDQYGRIKVQFHWGPARPKMTRQLVLDPRRAGLGRQELGGGMAAAARPGGSSSLSQRRSGPAARRRLGL